jgi:hypothetical protein
MGYIASAVASGGRGQIPPGITGKRVFHAKFQIVVFCPQQPFAPPNPCYWADNTNETFTQYGEVSWA